uniref:ATP synthase F0 subunit 6 n=1 Tax=Teredorus guangxiensis TaxID=510007 RepID=UPI0028D6EF7A|nr:ATP synthase F0 subunit 6 [Teredorus guangxiensis]WMV02072.1 ATP synthase F0 subunit 6 [Teredorus guangxiensis]
MMTNLFSSFDPSTSTSLSMNWMSMFMFMMIMPMTFWMSKSRTNIMMQTLSIKLYKEFNIIMSKNKGSEIIFIAMFMMIAMNNFMGLFPYVFTSTSHMAMTLSLALPMWMGINLFGWTKKTNHMFEHLVPMGTPPLLMPFMVCIETISSMIRPGTLAIRLAANMIAGHLLLTLMGNTGNKLNEMLLMGMLTVQMMLLILESAVAIIQGYVFSVLATLYSSEVN